LKLFEVNATVQTVQFHRRIFKYITVHVRYGVFIPTRSNWLLLLCCHSTTGDRYLDYW